MTGPAYRLSREMGWQTAELGGSSGGRVELSSLAGVVLSDPLSMAELTSLQGLRYAFAPGESTLTIATPDIRIPDAGFWLEYVLAPAAGAIDRRSGAGVTVELVFDDGSRSSALGMRDQHGTAATAEGQAAAGTLHVEQWNYRAVELSACEGRRVIAIVLASAPGEDGGVVGYIDEVRIGSGRTLVPSLVASIVNPEPVDYVDTRRGTRSSSGYSRGNCLPATANPRGSLLLTPVTDAGSVNWLYTYDAARDDTGLPWLEAFSISHQPSPWMGDWGTFQFFPSLDHEGLPRMGRRARALPFRHSQEVARPHLYEVEFEQPLTVRIAPTAHGAIVEMRFLSEIGTVIFDNIDDRGSLEFDGAVVRATSWVGGEHSENTPLMHVHLLFDRAPIEAERVETEGRGAVAGFARFALGADRTLRFRIGTSFVSADIATSVIEEELPSSLDLDAVSAASAALWNDELRVLVPEGATEDQLTTLYSNLYRLFLYPSDVTETSVDGTAVHANLDGRGGSSGGAAYANNGFWDTYRTSWPAYALLRPRLAGALADGFLQHYRDYGWMPRWSAPGPANAMVGTNSDIIFADLAVKGITGYDRLTALEASLANATIVPPAPNVGRKGLPQANYLQYTPQSIDESVSWSLENSLNDFGIAVQLAEAGRPDGYFRSRAARYQQLFDPDVGFFRGRDAGGAFRAAQFDPLEWGGDNTETNAWTMLFAVPHDIAGLAELLGGPRRLEERLDEYFATPETAEERLKGSYPFVIHEMLEARDVGLGMCGLSNQPAHHVPYLYAHTDSPHKIGPLIASALRRLFVGSEIGQGYLGDEDNGEMSAWYLFSALGLYPVHVGTPFYVMTVPLFPSITVNLEDGARFVVEANVAPEHLYIQGAWLNGVAIDRAFLRHDEITAGGTLRLELGSSPSAWGRGTRTALPSLGGTPGWEDLATAESIDGSIEGADALVDDDSDTAMSIDGAVMIEFALPDPREIQAYTLTSSAAEPVALSWVLRGRTGGQEWSEVDRVTDHPVDRDVRLVPFVPAAPGVFEAYRFEFATRGSVELAEVELLADTATTAAGVTR